MILRLQRNIPHTSRVLKKSGFCSHKVGKALHADSPLETQSFLLMEFDKRVDTYVSQGYSTMYQNGSYEHRYTPDIVAKLSNGNFVSIEVKPRNELNKPKNKTKFKLLKRHFEENVGHPLLFLTEVDIHDGDLYKNLHDLYRYRRFSSVKHLNPNDYDFPNELTFGELVSLTGGINDAKKLVAFDLFEWDKKVLLQDTTRLQFCKGEC
jgi:hypothetical protein